MIQFLLIFYLCNYSISAQFRWSEIEIPVRDAKKLKADLWSSDTTIQKPCILIQTPYNKFLYRAYPKMTPQITAFFDTANYHFVIMDWRGFYSNQNAADPKKDRGEDGFDAIEWIAIRIGAMEKLACPEAPHSVLSNSERQGCILPIWYALLHL